MTNHDRFASVFSTRAGQTFTTAEIRELMLANTDIEVGSILPNDHGMAIKDSASAWAWRGRYLTG